MTENKCKEHSGCVAKISNLEKDSDNQWIQISKVKEFIESVEDKVDKKLQTIYTRINVILGGIAVSCILLTINVIIKKGG